MSEPRETTVRALLASAGIDGADGELQLKRLSGGANNRVYEVSAGPSRAALKVYFEDDRPRLRAEFAFLEFAQACGADAVPAPLARDDTAGMALYEFVFGRRLSPEEVDGPAVQQAAALFAAVNRERARLSREDLPDGAEACFSISQHVELIDGRVRALLEFAPADDVDKAAAALVTNRLSPTWDRCKRRLIADASVSGLDADALLAAGELCVSPSDFGFHNALIDRTGRVRFIDFEYAGWDDPAKLVCDFFAQVAVPAPREHRAAFEAVALAPFDGRHRIGERVALLTPAYTVKWACIVLGDFLRAGRARRSYALGREEERERRLGQVAKAEAVLADLPTS